MGNLNEELSKKIISMSGISHFYDKINDRFIPYYKELVNDAEEGSLAIITNSGEPKSINDYLEFNSDSIALTGVNLPTEVDESRISPILNKYLYFLSTGYTSFDQIGSTPKGFLLVFMSGPDGETALCGMIPELGGYPFYLYTNVNPDTLNDMNLTTNGVQPQAVNELNQYISSIGNLKFYGLIGDEFDSKNGWFTDIEITPEEIDSINYLLLNNSASTDLYIRRNNTWQNITGDVDWLKNPSNIANNIDSNQIKFEMNPIIKNFVESQGIKYNLDGIDPNAVEGIINYNAFFSAAAYADAQAAIRSLNDYKNDSIIKTTHSELVSLINRNSLSPGAKYRITDYITTTTQDGTQSARYPFDIIVTALTNNTLSEDAKAIKCFNTERYESKKADIYNFNEKNTWVEYSGVDADAGPILPDNVLALKNEAGIDTISTDYGEINITDDNINLYKSGVFKVTLQGDTGNGVQVVGFGAALIKEGVFQDMNFSVDKESYYLRLPEDATTGTYVLRFYAVGSATSINNGVVGARAELFDDTLHYFDNNDLNAWEIKYCLNNDTSRFAWADAEDGKGVIYYMKDEYGNECYYDFKNIQFLRTSKFFNTNSFLTHLEGDNYYYTFSKIYNDKIIDISTYNESNTYAINNHIGVRGQTQRKLTDIIFINSIGVTRNNIIGDSSYSCTFGDGCHDNIIADYCYNNIIGNEFKNNNIKQLFTNNKVTGTFQYNTLGIQCYNNNFNGHIWFTTFGSQFNYCSFNIPEGSKLEYCEFGSGIGFLNGIPAIRKVTFENNVAWYNSTTYVSNLETVDGRTLEEAITIEHDEQLYVYKVGDKYGVTSFSEMQNPPQQLLISNPGTPNDNANGYGYIGTLQNLGALGDIILVDTLSFYVRDNHINKSPNVNTPIWCRLFKFINDAWKLVYQSKNSIKIGDYSSGDLISFKMESKSNEIIKSSDKIAIIYSDSDDINVFSSTNLGTKSVLNKAGGLNNALVNSSTGANNYYPAIVVSYTSMASTPGSNIKTINGESLMGSGDIEIKSMSIEVKDGTLIL